MGACEEFAETVRAVLPHLREMPNLREADVIVCEYQVGNTPWSVCLRVSCVGGAGGLDAWELARRLGLPLALSWIVVDGAEGAPEVVWWPSPDFVRHVYLRAGGHVGRRYSDQTFGTD